MESRRIDGCKKVSREYLLPKAGPRSNDVDLELEVNDNSLAIRYYHVGDTINDAHVR